MPTPTRISTPKACRKCRETVTESIRTIHTPSLLPSPHKDSHHRPHPHRSKVPTAPENPLGMASISPHPQKPSPRPKTSAITKTQISPYEHVDAPN
ncbi:hypothetical protein CKAH01_05236 [Colletotrichum kahawae]|uniref:Uncharacterized protein n=1 Tax=Colletotrichum kahawae TaxID=34407 RepID=A0AAD9YFL1_COLKA|nr:hypothetical protein CKAH01_05236 [Colletotrichum kahawae]